MVDGPLHISINSFQINIYIVHLYLRIYRYCTFSSCVQFTDEYLSTLYISTYLQFTDECLTVQFTMAVSTPTRIYAQMFLAFCILHGTDSVVFVGSHTNVPAICSASCFTRRMGVVINCSCTQVNKNLGHNMEDQPSSIFMADHVYGCPYWLPFIFMAVQFTAVHIYGCPYLRPSHIFARVLFLSG